MTSTSQERRSHRVRKKASVLQDENFVHLGAAVAVPRERSSRSPDEPWHCRTSATTMFHHNRHVLLYGLERDSDAPADVCAACRKSAEELTETVLLCDGLHCHREYHLSCAGLTRIPADDEPFYCFDCHPIGNRSDLLQKYLEQHLDERDVAESQEHWSQTGVWKQIMDKDIDRLQLAHSPRGSKKVISRQDVRIPRSELHSPRLWLANATTTTTTETKSFLVGCPVRLYVPLLNDYVAGRITDHRENKQGISEHYVRFPAGTLEMKISVGGWIVLEEHCLLVNTGVVVVMALASEQQQQQQQQQQEQQVPVVPALPNNTPGCGEKRSFTQAELGVEKPKSRRRDEVASAWVRTSRELLSLKNIQTLPLPFYGPNESPWSSGPLSSSTTTTTRTDNSSPQLVMIRNFGTSNKFRFVEATRLRQLDITQDDAHLDSMAFALAKGELMEKKRVRDWYSLRCQPTGSYGSLKRDVDEFPTLDIRPRVTAFSLSKGKDVYPCPAIRPGLDRTYIAQRLQKLGVPVDKEVAASIECNGGKPFYCCTAKSSKGSH